MLREIKDKLGFDLIELGHGIRISLMPGIQKMFDAGEVRFSSLHNFCPLPVEVMAASPDCYKFSSVHAGERERAIKQTFQTIDFAERLGAPFVVLHLGEVKMRPVTDPLIRLAKVGKYLSRRYVKLKCIVLYDCARPYSSREVVLGDKLTCRLNQNFDDFERAAPDRDGHSTRSQFAPSEIDLPLVQLIHQSSVLCAHSRPLFRLSHVSSEFGGVQASRAVPLMADNRCCVAR
jgi:hypothetical protein